MKKTFFLSFLFLPLVTGARAQTGQPSYGISFSGFVKSDFFYDSREVVSIREGHFLLYPQNKSLDSDGNDINANPSFNFLSIQSRLTGRITAPDAFGAKTSGVLEADFFGNENAAFVDANGFRLRHAYVKLNWEKTELLAGQSWHPFFITGCYSGVVSFNTGAPMQPFSRNPQLRLTHKFGKLSLAGALSAQRDFTSPGGSAVLRYSGIPDLSAILSFESINADTKTEFLAGAGIDYKVLQPLLSTSKGPDSWSTDEKVAGLSWTAFLKYKNAAITYKIQGVYGQNLYDQVMLGGFAIHEVTDTAKNSVSYTTVNNLSAWTEIQTNGAKLQFGLWAGYTQNLGAKETVYLFTNQVGGTSPTVRGSNIHHVFRVSPRLVFIQGKLNFATELEFTQAAYATRSSGGPLNRDEYGVITDWESVSNLRVLLAFIYNF